MSPTLIGLIISLLLLVCTPGPSTLLAASLGASGIVHDVARLIAGVVAGILVSCCAVACLSWMAGGSDQVVATFRRAAGIAIMVLGGRMLVRPIGPSRHRVSISRPFQSGFMVSALNPKPALFYIAVLPSLASGNAETKSYIGQVILIVGIHLSLAAASLTAYAFIGHRILGRVSATARSRIDAAIGALFLIFGTALLTNQI